MTAQMLWGILTAMEEQRPRIRPGVELLPTLHQGQQAFVLRDRWGISPDLVLKDKGALILSLMDGVNDLRDIQVMLMRRWGLALVGMEELKELIENLDAHFLLDNQRFQLRKRSLSKSLETPWFDYRLTQVAPILPSLDRSRII